MPRLKDREPWKRAPAGRDTRGGGQPAKKDNSDRLPTPEEHTTKEYWVWNESGPAVGIVTKSAKDAAHEYATRYNATRAVYVATEVVAYKPTVTVELL